MVGFEGGGLCEYPWFFLGLAILAVMLPGVVAGQSRHQQRTEDALLGAIESRDIAEIALFMPPQSVEFEWNVYDPDRNLLRNAVEANFVEAAAYFLEAGADPLYRPGIMNPGRSALQFAILARFGGGNSGWEFRDQPGPAYDELLSLLVAAIPPDRADELARQVNDESRALPEEVPRAIVDTQRYVPPDGRHEIRPSYVVRSVQSRAFFAAVDGRPGPFGSFDVGLRVGFPLAESELQDSRQPDRYGAALAFDGRNETSWVESAPGAGLGQRIAFVMPKNARSIAILPGYGDRRYFHRNYRVRTATLDFYYITGGIASDDVWPSGAYVPLQFRDEMTLQEFALDEYATMVESFAAELQASPPVTGDTEFDVIGVLTIESVYSTGEWEDTPIAEIQVNTYGREAQ